MQRRRPPLGSRIERGERRWFECEPVPLGEERARLTRGEAQVARADLQQFAARPQPRQRERRRVAAGEDEMEASWRSRDDLCQRGVDARSRW
ncbi:MAG: hypothetical protein U0841_02275 [Chloroflexia bacterium]